MESHLFWIHYKGDEMETDIFKSLFGVVEEKYGPSHAGHTMDQYKLYVEMANKISDRRQYANMFFLATNSGLIALLGIAFPQTNGLDRLAWFLVVCMAALLLCISWFWQISSYKNLNSGKFKVIHELEKFLPVRPFHTEWVILGWGTNPTLYRPLTHIEIIVPWVFFGLYLVLAAIGVLSWSRVF